MIARFLNWALPAPPDIMHPLDGPTQPSAPPAPCHALCPGDDCEWCALFADVIGDLKIVVGRIQELEREVTSLRGQLQRLRGRRR